MCLELGSKITIKNILYSFSVFKVRESIMAKLSRSVIKIMDGCTIHPKLHPTKHQPHKSLKLHPKQS